MFKNQVTVAFRHLIRHKWFSLLSLSSLMIGITSCLVIFSFIRYERSYDQFHQHAGQIFRLIIDQRDYDWIRIPAPIATELFDQHPQIDYVRFYLLKHRFLAANQHTFYEDLTFTDPNVFDIFSFTFIYGDSKTALQSPNTIVITQKIANKYFGNKNPIGETLTYRPRRHPFTITGVVKDLPSNSHFHPQLLVSLSSLDNIGGGYSENLQDRKSAQVYTYLHFAPDYTQKYFENQAADLVHTYFEHNNLSFKIQPLTDIHLHSHLENEWEINGDATYIYIFSFSACILLIIACINFVNITMAMATTCIKEVGIRKVVGAQRHQLIRQFLIESLILSVTATAFSIGLSYDLIPFINTHFGYELTLGSNSLFWGGLLLCTILLGIISGSYPAFYLSAYQPQTMLKGNLKNSGKKAHFRHGLVVTQFALSAVLIISTGVVNDQLTYIKNKNIGLNNEDVLVIPLSVGGKRSHIALKEAYLQMPEVIHASLTRNLPGERIGFATGREKDSDPGIPVRRLRADYDFIQTFGLELIEGRNFSPKYANDETEAYIINQTTAKRFGWQSPIGKLIDFGQNVKGYVIGVVKDFNYASLHQEVEPLCLDLNTKSRALYLCLRLQNKNMPNTLPAIQNKWESFRPTEWPFEYFFLDYHLDRFYKSDHLTAQISRVFSAISILTACLGMLGLVVFAAERRTKEFGIRKVLGATTSNILYLMTKDSLKWICLANLVAFPFAYYIATVWLQNFAYRTSINLDNFAMSFALTLGLTLLTISYQVIKTARANPVYALRNE